MKTSLTVSLLVLLASRALPQTLPPIVLPIRSPTPQAVRLGTNVVVPGKLVEFTVPLTVNAKWWVGQAKRKADSAKGGLIVPQGFDPRKPCRLLIVSVPSGGWAIPSLRFYTNVAFSRDWAVL